MVVEVAVLVVGLSLALIRTTCVAGARAVPPDRRRLHRLLPRHADGDARLPPVGSRRCRPGGGLEWLPTNPVILAGFGLMLSYSAYVAEVFRAGIQSIHPSQRAAALALGLTGRRRCGA